MNRTEALAVIVAESEKEHMRLAELHQKDDLLYEPNPQAIYVWELEITRVWEHNQRHTFTQLFVTRDLAVREACKEIDRYLSPAGSHRRQFNELIAAENFEEAMELFQTHFLARVFNFSMVQVRA